MFWFEMTEGIHVFRQNISSLPEEMMVTFREQESCVFPDAAHGQLQCWRKVVCQNLRL